MPAQRKRPGKPEWQQLMRQGGKRNRRLTNEGEPTASWTEETDRHPEEQPSDYGSHRSKRPPCQAFSRQIRRTSNHSQLEMHMKRTQGLRDALGIGPGIRPCRKS